jgi:hypothetical protein
MNQIAVIIHLSFTWGTSEKYVTFELTWLTSATPSKSLADAETVRISRPAQPDEDEGHATRTFLGRDGCGGAMVATADAKADVASELIE